MFDGKTRVIDGKTCVIDDCIFVIDGSALSNRWQTRVIADKTGVIDDKTFVIDGKVSDSVYSGMADGWKWCWNPLVTIDGAVAKW